MEKAAAAARIDQTVRFSQVALLANAPEVSQAPVIRGAYFNGNGCRGLDVTKLKKA
jgi:hypothetical protein